MHIQEREASSLASVLLKVFRKNIAQREKEKEYKELAHAVMEVEKAPDLPSTSYRPRRINGVVLIQVWRPESQEGRWFSSNPGAMGLKPKSYSFSLHLKIGKDWCPSSAGRQPFCSVIGWGPPTLGGTICFTEATNSKISISFGNTLRHTQDKHLSKCQGILWPTRNIKLIITSSKKRTGVLKGVYLKR